MNEQLLIAMRDTLLELAEKHDIRVSDKVVEFFDDVLTAEGVGEE
jgi:hypothetical protein